MEYISRKKSRQKKSEIRILLVVFFTSRKKFATPSVHFYKSFQTTEIDLLCTLSEISSTPYKSEQREYNLTISSILFNLEEHMEPCAEREAWIDLRLMTCVYMLIA